MRSPGERFAAFAEVYSNLPLYHRLSMAAADDPEVAALISVARPGQQRPVLLLAAVHDLVLRRPDLDLARWYSSVTPPSELADGDPWPAFRRTVLEHRDELAAIIGSRSTQTNEVNRAVIVAVLCAAACADRPTEAVSLVELGTSAGLLLGTDRYRVDVAGTVVGDPDSAVQCAGDVRVGPVPDLDVFPPTVTERVGIDRDPIDLTDPDGVRWLEACLWPDEPWRIERFRSAVAQLRDDPPRVVAGDFIDALPGVIASLDAVSHLVVFDVWALTYVAEERRGAVADLLGRAGADGRAVSWLSAEPPGVVPGITPPDTPAELDGLSLDTVLGLRRWRDGVEDDPVTLGWAHAHGNWIAPVHPA